MDDTDNNPIPLATYTCHPIQRFRAGPFRFENATLKLYKESEVEDFEKSLAAMPPSERNRIKKVDLAAAEAMVKQMLAAQGGATKQTDSTIGERGGKPQVGKEDLIQQGEKAIEGATKPAGLNLGKTA